MTGPAAIVLDWGTSSLRAALATARGEILEARESAGGGIQFVRDGAFEAALMEIAGDWFAAHGPLSVWAGGMITSRNGWVEVPYVDAPADARALAAGTRARSLANGAAITFLPGMRDPAALPFPDVMRGEEAQVVGLGLERNRICVLPGTHSKWVRVADGRIAGFQTFVTGEIFALLTRHSFIARATEGPAGAAPDWQAFDTGARFAASDAPAADAFLSAIFSGRAGILDGRLQPEQMQDYISGLTIGSEFRQARAAGWFSGGETVDIIGNDALTDRYARIAPLFSLSGAAAPADAAMRGILLIARAAPGGLAA